MKFKVFNYKKLQDFEIELFKIPKVVQYLIATLKTASFKIYIIQNCIYNSELIALII